MKKILTFVLAAAIAVSAGALAGCKPKISNDENTLEIYFLNAGYGDQFVADLAAAFEAEHEGVNVEYWGDDLDQTAALLQSGTTNTVDLFIIGGDMDSYAMAGANVHPDYDIILENIDEVMEYEENGVMLKDKFIRDAVPQEIDGHYYSFSWAVGATGLIYNASKFEILAQDNPNIAVPNTTDELVQLCEDIKAAGEIPFVFSVSTNYWEYMTRLWYMQYEGAENVKNFFLGIDNGAYSRDIFLQQGRLESLEALNSLIRHELGNNHDNVNLMNFAQSQAQFISGNGLMMVNGDWLENEMRNVANEDENKFEFRMMKTPVVSALSEKLSYWKEGKTFAEATKTMPAETRKEYDEKLSAIIDYVDAGEPEGEKPSFATEDDVLIVRNARNVGYTIGGNHTVGIPVYATAKDLAKEFLKFMLSDEGYRIYFDATTGNQLPIKYDLQNDTERWGSMSAFAKSRYEVTIANPEYENLITTYGTTPLTTLGGLTLWVGDGQYAEEFFATKDEKHYKTPYELYRSEYEDEWTVEKFNLMLKNSGIDPTN